MAKDAAAIAAELREKVGDGDLEAFMEAMAPLYGDTITLAHEPPLPNDGTMNGADLEAMESGMIEQVRKIVPDYRHEEFSAEADGELLIIRETRVGTLPDGTASRVPAKGVFTVVDGRITSATMHVNMDDLASFMAAMSNAGVATPVND